MTVSAPIIEVDVRRRFAGFELDVAFTAELGVTALFGRSGAGKTTLINLIAGLDRPDEGRIAIAGVASFDSALGLNVPPEKRRVGYVFQEDRLFPHLDVEANLTYGMRRVPAAERRIDRGRVIDMLGIGHLLRRRPHHLSGGEKQRIAIGRALLANPRLLLLDEPLANLDQQRRGEILLFIETVQEELGVPLIYVSHNVDEVIRLADTVVLMADGRVASVGTVEETMRRPDLRALTGGADAGAVVSVTVDSHDAAYGLTTLAFAGGTLVVGRHAAPLGARLRVRVHARDVALALQRPSGISTLNVLEGTITELAGNAGPQIDVLLDVGTPLWARITRRSADELGLVPGKRIYALIKSVALDRGEDEPGARGEG